MTYTLTRLAPGSYDVDLDGSIIASLVHEPGRGRALSKWHIELLGATPRVKRPAPFSDQTHTFSSFEEAADWLGVKEAASGE